MYLILLYNIYSKRKTDFIMEIRMALDGIERNKRNKTSTTYSESNFTIVVCSYTLSRWTYKHVLGEII